MKRRLKTIQARTVQRGRKVFSGKEPQQLIRKRSERSPTLDDFKLWPKRSIVCCSNFSKLLHRKTATIMTKTPNFSVCPIAFEPCHLFPPATPCWEYPPNTKAQLVLE